MNQTKKPAAPAAAERNEKVRQVLLAASVPLSTIEIAERIGEDWCMWNGSGLGSAVKPVLGNIGAKSHKGKWSIKAHEIAIEPFPVEMSDPASFHVMSVTCRDRIKEAMAVPQQ